MLIDYILPFLFILTIVVFVHEFGHFWVARKNGVQVETFSIGFGREIFGFTDKHGTRWKFALLPLGGYVKMFGDADETSSKADDREMTEEEKAIAFPHKTVGQRAAIIAAGPFANLAFAIVVLSILFMTVGQPSTPPVIGSVMAESAAEKAGLQSGDRVLVIDGEKIDRFEDIQRKVKLSAGEALKMRLERSGTDIELLVVPQIKEFTDKSGNVQKTPLLGIGAGGGETTFVKYGPGGALVQSFVHTWRVIEGTFSALGQMISGKRGTEELGGPLRIAQYSGHAAQGGPANFIYFIAILSINLGLINLFPVPMLDGGHLLFCAIEKIKGAPLGQNLQEYGFRIGVILVLALMVFSTWNDIVHLRVWDFIKGLVS